MKQITVTPETYELYKGQIIAMEEACFEGDLLFDDEEIKDMVLAGSNIFFEDKGRLIAGTYFQPISTLTTDDFYDENYGCQFNPQEFNHSDAIYINSTAVLPEYRSKGLIYDLKDALFDRLREENVVYVVGHAHEGKMWHINEKYGAESLIEYKDWYGEGVHHFYEINLLKQHNDWSCGVYSLYYLLKLNKNKLYTYEGELSRGTMELPKFSQLYKEINPSEENGTSHKQIIDWLTKNKLLFEENSGKIGGNYMVNYQYDGDGHYSVILRANHSNLPEKNSIDLYNPAIGEIETILLDDFVKNWYSVRYGKNWSLMIGSYD